MISTSASEAHAWLFDCYPHPRRSAIVLWIKHGAKVTKRVVPYQPDFCLRAEHAPLAEAEAWLAKDDRVAATWRSRCALWLRGPEEPVLRVRPKSLHDVHALATDLRRAFRSKGFTFFDVDNQPESRWLHDHGLWPMCRLAVDDQGRPLLEAAADEERFTHEYPTPDLRTVHLRVFVDEDGPTRDDAGFTDDLLAIQLGGQLLQVGTVGDPEEERLLLLRFGQVLRELDPDVLFTQHGDRFDIPYLLERIRRYELHHQLWLGREPDPVVGAPDQKAKSIHTYGRWLFKTAAYYLRGRWHIDLSKKTLDSEDDRKDIHGVLYLARVSNRRAQDVNRNGAGYALQQMQIDLAQDQGVAIPWKRNLVEDWKDAATLCAVDRGGQIMVPTPGIYGDVAACDFSGYYPSLIVEHNLSSDSINCTCCPDGELVPELGYHLCKQRGHQARVLERLNHHRRWAKATMRQAKRGLSVPHDTVEKARAIKSEHKALGVVCFGYFRYRNARFGCAEVHQAIQCYGRKGMTDARRLAQEAGYTMVHTMTDCTFLQREGMTRDDALGIARAITNKVGVQMELEGIYRWVVFLPSKVHSKSAPGAVGVPNRYYGKFTDGSLKVRGIDVQKHSTPDWLRDVQWGMLHLFQEADDVDGFLARIPRALQVAKAAADRLIARAVDARDLGTVIQSTRAVEEYTAQTNARTALLRLRDAGTERKPGEYLKYVVTREKGPKESRVVPIELFDQQPAWFQDVRVGYNVNHYLRLLARSVENLVAPFGYDEEGLYQWLAGRADAPKPPPRRRVDLPSKPEWVAA
ncbi:MAG: DNA polymerase domain-containing protein [Thermoplasmatota archaeon]